MPKFLLRSPAPELAPEVAPDSVPALSLDSGWRGSTVRGPLSARSFLHRIVLFNIVLIVVSILLGLYKTGNPSRYFGERRYITFISAAQLLAIGGLAGMTYRKRRRVAAGGASSRYGPVLVWLLMGAGFVFLAVDEVAELHEKMDRWIIRFLDLPRTPLTGRIDDAIIGCYGLIGLGVMWCCRKELLPFWKVMRGPLTAGFVCLFLGVLCDTAAHDDHFFHWLTGNLATAKKLNGWFSALEGGLTLLPEALFLGAFYAAYRHAGQPVGAVVEDAPTPLAELS